jgi:hypothetical protein
MDETLALAGNIIEPKIRDYVSNITNNEYISYDPKTIRFDCFRDNKIFGGIPDGEPKHGYLTNNDCMLEIKTTSIDKIKYCIDDNLNFKMIKNSSGVPEVSIPNQKKNEWYDENGGLLIPYEYQLQLGLYLFLRNVEYGLFAIGFLSPIDYVYPHQFDPIVKAKDNNLVLQKISIHDISDLHKHIDYAQK